jgi:very-short-patch-repair endonuclease
MALKFSPADIDNLIALYLTGKRATECAEIIGMNEGYARGLIKKHVAPDVRAAHAAAMLTTELRSRRIKGVWDRRDAAARAEVGRLVSRGMLEKTTPDFRKEAGRKGGLVGRRGKIESFEKKCARALTVERLGLHPNATEDRIAADLEARGVVFHRQRAIGPYLGDFAIGSVIVEIVRQFGCASVHPATFAERTRYIFDAGWRVLFVWLAKDAVTLDVADNIIANVDRISADPIFARQYRVIRGTGEFLTSGSADNDKMAFKWPRARRKNPPARHDESVAR